MQDRKIYRQTSGALCLLVLLMSGGLAFDKISGPPGFTSEGLEALVPLVTLFVVSLIGAWLTLGERPPPRL